MADDSRLIPDVLVTTYLHLTDPDKFQPAFVDLPSIAIRRMDTPDVPLYRLLYRSVGEQWRWRDRNSVSDDDLRAVLAEQNRSVYILYMNETPSGFVELVTSGSDMEIAYFGLRPDFMGMGLGKHLLSFAVDRAWRDGAERITVHTCNLDAPQALPNYLKRGFQVFDVRHQPMPDTYRE
jgi:GNAT superfamily N-acetyltransferase